MAEPEVRRLPDLGRVGVWTGGAPWQSPGRNAELAAEVEELGYGAVWLGEGMTRDPFLDADAMLRATSRLTLATGIAIIALRQPWAVNSLTARLADAHPDRFLLGLGTSNAAVVRDLLGLPFDKPLTAMRDYLAGLDAARAAMAAMGIDAVGPRQPRVLSALGPKMLALAASHAEGTHPYLVPPEHTELARQTLGPGPLVAPEQAVVLSTDPAVVRRRARAHVGSYLARSAYPTNWLRLGFTEEDLADGGSDRLVDAVVVGGDAETIRRRVQAHLDAGADHVCIQALGDDPMAIDVDQWRELAPALLS
ncbi:TIGR03620 family F420-dependent LLM class oxidoreductase [Actinoalloteichus hymeniacidonis]|uniref:F420-dependent oxidoreductase n=1 Tax=Actinoalloteichus hymeniacidonis TaxID=340345 RepID=A0AAC9HM24_9PSEU|nr:TIGR03620 family F420-dependent LLM class oxidoreductase [Actinoalloteichus hymeniacidonis]AOS61281.1 putative F420-dependent oxidoreductase [Actinoalloteichus hymeniacidonis]MBB5910716.1 putative F420-dependent oxidoreductase [Actinoalloteichus hymeniacidonis]